MFDGVSAVLTSTQTAFEMAKGLLNLKEGAAVQEKAVALTSTLIELQQHVIEAQKEQMQLLATIERLEKEKAQLLDNNEVFSQYELTSFPTGHHAYVLKPEFRPSSGMVSYLCSRCFETGKRYTLHGSITLFCPECKSEVRTQPRKPMSAIRGTHY